MVTQNMVRVHMEERVFSKEDVRFVAAFDLIKCLEQVNRDCTIHSVSYITANIYCIHATFPIHMYAITV